MRKKLLAVVSLAFAAALSTGIAVSASAETEPTKLEGFKIDGVSVRVTDEVRTDADGNERNTSGIRFKTVTPETKDAYESAERVVTTLSIDGIGSRDVAAQAWRADNKGWNTILVDIPQAHYTTKVTAQSFIYLNETTAYKTDEVTSSIALAASQALNLGKATEAQVGKYVEGVVTEITLNKTETVSIVEGDAVQLTATTKPEGYSVVWSSSNTDVATVDNTGKVVMQAASGSATITATMSGKTASVEVTSAGMAKVLHFDNGVNNYITTIEENDVAECVGANASAEGVTGPASGALRYDPGNWEFNMGISAAYLANVFADENVGALQFKMYSNKDGFTTNNTWNGNAVEGSYLHQASSTSKIKSGYTLLDMGDYLLMTISKAAYEQWSALGTDEVLGIFMRLGTKFTEDTGVNKAGQIAYEACAHVYLDDVQGITATAATGDFEDGNASFVENVVAENTCTLAGIVEREEGNYALEVKAHYNNYIGFNKAFVDAMFADESVTAIQYKVYTDWQICGLSTPYFVGFARNGSWWQYKSASQITIEAKDGYLLVTIYRGIWKTMHDKIAQYTADGTLTSGNVYAVCMRLSATAGGTNAIPTESIYLDDFVAVKAEA